MTSPRVNLPEKRAGGVCLPRPRNVRRERMSVPKERMCIPRGRMNVPRKRMRAPRRRMDVPPRRMNVPQGRMNVPERRLDAPGRRMNAPREGMNVPRGRMSVPRARFHGKHRGERPAPRLWHGRRDGYGRIEKETRRRLWPPKRPCTPTGASLRAVSAGNGRSLCQMKSTLPTGVPPTWDRVCRRSAPRRSVETRQSICTDGTATTNGGASLPSGGRPQRPPTPNPSQTYPSPRPTPIPSPRHPPHTKIRGASASLTSSVATVFPSVSRYRPCPRSIRHRFLPLRLAS